MTAIEDRLQELRLALSPPDLPSADQVAQRGKQRRRRRRAVGALSVLTVLALVPLVFMRLSGDGEKGQVISGGPPDPGAPPPGATRLSESGIPAVLFATNVWDGSVLVSDLDAGFRATYPDGEHSLDFKDAADIQDVPADDQPASTSSRFVAAALTNNDELIAGVQSGPVVAFPAGRAADGQDELVAGGLHEPGREIFGAVGWSHLLPTDSGDGVWVQTSAGDLELVGAQTGDVRQSVTRPSGSRLVDVVGDNAVVYNDFNDPGSVSVVSPSGETTILEPPETASFVAASPTRSVWIAGDRDTPGGSILVGVGETVLVVADDGDTTSIPVPAGAGGRWAWLGSQTGIGSMRTLTSDDAKLLLTLTDPNDPSSTIPTRLVVVDIEKGTADIVFEAPGGLEAFWARDDRTAIVIHSETGGEAGQMTVTTVDTVTAATTPIDDAVPDGFDVIAGR
jgi:hypothetical protein